MEKESLKEFPVGTAFLSFNEAIIEVCSSATDEFLRTAGEKVPLTAECLGTLLSYLYRAASCFWGCEGGDHQIQWLCGRVVNQSLAAFRLIRGSYYDESLMLTRGIGEIANLLCLFRLDKREYEGWRNADSKTRKNNFGPAKIRLKLEKVWEAGALIDEKRYAKLCEIGTHPIPSFRPGHFDGSGIPKLGGVVQEAGICVTLNELAYAAAISGAAFAILLGGDGAQRKLVHEAAVTLLDNIGSVDIFNYDELLRSEYILSQTPGGGREN